jgi:hypothetical protein
MDKNILILMVVMMIPITIAGNFDWLYNPYTTKQDRSLSLNQTNYNFTADYFFGNAQFMTNAGNISWNETYARTLFLLITDQRYNDTIMITSIGNWSADKSSYSTKAQADLLYTNISEPIAISVNDSWKANYTNWNSSGYIKNWNESGFIVNQSYNDGWINSTMDSKDTAVNDSWKANVTGYLPLGDQRYNDTLNIESRGNWTNDKPYYWNTSINANVTTNITASWFKGIFNWIIGSTSTAYLSFNGTQLDYNETKLNVTIDNKLATTTYLPTSYNTAGGTESGGNNLGNLSYYDNRYFNITEVTGAPPVLDLYVNFTGVDTITNLNMRERYIGGNGHEIAVEIYDYILSGWEGYGVITDQSGMVVSSYPILDPTDHIISNKVQVRLRHVQNGLPTHKLQIDFITLSDGITSYTTNEHDSLSGRYEDDNHPQYLLIDGTRNMTGNLVVDNKNITYVNYLNPSGTQLNIGGNINAIGNVTANEFRGAINWTYLQNYPVACPANSAVTTIGDSNTCTDGLYTLAQMVSNHGNFSASIGTIGTIPKYTANSLADSLITESGTTITMKSLLFVNKSSVAVNQILIEGTTQQASIGFQNDGTGRTASDGFFFGINDIGAAQFYNYEEDTIAIGNNGSYALIVDSGKTVLGDVLSSTSAPSGSKVTIYNKAYSASGLDETLRLVAGGAGAAGPGITFTPAYGNIASYPQWVVGKFGMTYDGTTSYGGKASIYVNDNSNTFTGLAEVMQWHSSKNVYIPNDNAYLKFGAGQDAGIMYDGTDMIINPQIVGTGIVRIGPSTTSAPLVGRVNIKPVDNTLPFITLEGANTGDYAPWMSYYNIHYGWLYHTIMDMEDGKYDYTGLTTYWTNNGAKGVAYNGVKHTYTYPGEYVQHVNNVTKTVISPTGNSYFLGGNVGIGRSPTTLLDIYQSSISTTPQVSISNAGTGDSALTFNTSAKSYSMGVDNSIVNDYFRLNEGDALGSSTNGLYYLNGYLGLNRVPTGTFDVYLDTAGQVALKVSTNNTGTGAYAWLAAQAATASYPNLDVGLTVFGEGFTGKERQASIVAGGDVSQFSIEATGSPTFKFIGKSDGNMIFTRYGIAQDMRINPNGSIYINDATDPETLYPNGWITSSGNRYIKIVSTVPVGSVYGSTGLFFRPSYGMVYGSDFWYDANGASTYIDNRYSGDPANYYGGIYLRTQTYGTPKMNMFLAPSGNTFITGRLSVNITPTSTNAPGYPLVVGDSVSGISIWTAGNISATGYNTRTDVYDKSQGSALDFIKDADAYKDLSGKINDSLFDYSSVSRVVQVVDKVLNKTIIEKYEVNGTNYTRNKVVEYATYKNITVTEVSLDKEVSMLKQALYELKIKNELLETELCKKDPTYSWCKE